MKLFLLGLDSLDPFLIDRWMNDLPTLKNLIVNGAFGQLKSTIPPVTLPAWPSMFTGKNPGKLGVFDFFEIEKKEIGYDMKLYSQNQWKGEYFWDILNLHKYKVGLINLPEFYQSYRILGYMVHTMGNFSVMPEWLSNKIQTDFEDFKNYSKKPFSNITDTLNNTNIDWKLNEYLMNEIKVDVLVHVFRILDIVSHKTDDINKIKKYYIMMDHKLSEYLSSYDFDTIMIVSDHGIKRYHKKFYFNTYLNKKGFLNLKDAEKNTNVIKHITYKILDYVPRSQNVFEYLNKYLSKSFNIDMKPTIKQLFEFINWNDSKVFAYALTNSNYIGLWNIKSENIIDGIIEDIKNVTDKKDKIISSVYKKDEIYSGNKLNNLPDYVIELNDKYLATSELSPIIFRNTNNFAHQLYGTIIANGKNIKEGIKINSANILDITPTVLDIFKIKVQNTFDGKKLNIFK